MVNMRKYFAVLIAMGLLVLTAGAQQPPDQPHNHSQRTDGVNQRGDHAMGFSHEKTTHHFFLTAEGGSIEVTAKDSADSESKEMIRTHLAHIAKLFKDGDFSMPMFIHGETPPGVATLKRLKTDISYTFEAIERGARVGIASTNAEAIEAIHAFLRYQINDHQTGDSIEVQKRASI